MTDCVVWINCDHSRRRWWGGWRPKRRIPPHSADTEFFVARRLPSGSWDLRPVLRGEEASILPDDKSAYLVAVWKGSFRDLELAFPAVAKDGQGHGWDLKLCGAWRVSDGARFLLGFALEAVSPEVPLSRLGAESWMAEKVRRRVRDAVRDAIEDNQGFERIRDEDVLPPEWWQKRLCEWLDGYGVSVELMRASWSSEDAELAKAERERQEYQIKAERARQRQREAQEREAAAAAQHEIRMREIETDIRISEKERESRIKKAEIELQTELVIAKTKYQEAVYAQQQAEAKHQIAMAEYRRQKAYVEQAKEQARQAEKEYEAIRDLLARATTALEKLACLPEEVVAGLAKRDTRALALDRLTSEEFGLSHSELAALGYPTVRQALIQRARSKAIEDNDTIQLRKANLHTRSLQRIRVERGRARDVGTAPVKGLRINEPLSFEFATRRPGFVTFLNAGTSGRVWLHVPNAYVMPQEARVDVEGTYSLPEPRLMPLVEAGMSYVEIGPPGWEHFLVFLSDEPLVCADVLCRARFDAPFVELSPTEIGALLQDLETRDPASWSAAALSFLVVED